MMDDRLPRGLPADAVAAAMAGPMKGPMAGPMHGPNGRGAYAATATADPATPPPFPRRALRPLSIDEDVIVQSVLRRARRIEDDVERGWWMEQRLQRYAKLRGIKSEPKTFPWPDCSDVFIPMMQTAELRANAGLHNVVMTTRPLVRAKATNPRNLDTQDRITQVVDAQMFVDPGTEVAERRWGDFISRFLQDGNSVAFTPWVRDERTLTLVQHRPPVPVDRTPLEYLETILTGEGEERGLFPADARITQDETLDHVFGVTFTGARQREVQATVEVFTDEDNALELVIRQPFCLYDGPVMYPLEIDDVLVRTRCTNLQPTTEWNPEGAPEVFIKRRFSLREIRSLKGKARGFNYLDDAGLAKIEALARGDTWPTEGEALKEQKDAAEGREHRPIDVQTDEETGHLEVECLVVFDRWALGGDEDEDAYFVIARDAEVLCEARRMTDRWPAKRPYRPLAEAACIPVPGRYYAISLLELGEALQDLVKGTFDIAFDGWTMGTIPFFIYGAGSKMPGDMISVAPGMGIPIPGSVDNIKWPSLPQRDTSAALGIIGLGIQFFNQQLANGPLQQGQVPTGKSSALRTFGTTYALLQQGDVRADQLLLRLFLGIGQVAANFHRMNRHLLPPGKEVKILGWDGPEAQGYLTINSLEEIDAEAEWEFRPDFLLTNPAVLNQALMSVLGVVVTPLAMEMGITDAQQIYRLVKDFIRSLRLDHKLYIHPPVDEGLPAMLAEEAIDKLIAGELPQGTPMEGPETHLKKLFAWVNSDAFGMLRPEQVQIAKAYLTQVGQRAREAQMMQAAQSFQNALNAAGEGQGAVPTTIQEPPVSAAAEPALPIPTGSAVMNA